MLNKIKVYRRSDAKEIYSSDDDFFALCFKKNGEIWLQYKPLQKSGVTVELTKTDPLGKFKKEIEGWWFCKEYVLIEKYSYNYIEIVNSEFNGLQVNHNTIYPNDIRYKKILQHLKKHKIVLRQTNTYQSIGEDKYIKLLEIIE